MNYKILILSVLTIVSLTACIQMPAPINVSDPIRASIDDGSQATIEALDAAIKSLTSVESSKQNNDITDLKNMITELQATKESEPTLGNFDNVMVVEAPTATPVVDLIVVTPTHVTSVKSQEDTIVAKFVSAEEAVKAKNYTSALSIYDEISDLVLGNDNQDLELILLLHIDKGHLYSLMREYDNSVKNASLAIDILRQGYTPSVREEQTLKDQLRRRALRYNRIGEFELALVDLTEALKIDPDYAKAYLERGVTYIQLDEYEIALEDLAKATSYGPMEEDADRLYFFKGLGHFYYAESMIHGSGSESQFRLAINEFNKAEEMTRIDETPLDLDIIWYNRGWSNFRLKNYDLALTDLLKVQDDSSDYYKALNGLGSIYHNQGKYDLAIDTYNKLIKLDPFSGSTYGNRGLAYDYKGDWQAALRDYDKAISMGDEWPVWHWNRGIIFEYNFNDYNTALKDYEEACRIDRYYCDKY